MRTGRTDHKMVKRRELSIGRRFWVACGVDDPANRTLIAEGAVHQLVLPPVKRDSSDIRQH